MVMDVVSVSVEPLLPSPLAVMVHDPGAAVVGIVIGSENEPLEFAVTCSVSRLHTLIVTLAPAAKPEPFNVKVPPGATVPVLVVSVPVHDGDPGG